MSQYLQVGMKDNPASSRGVCGRFACERSGANIKFLGVAEFFEPSHHVHAYVYVKVIIYAQFAYPCTCLHIQTYTQGINVNLYIHISTHTLHAYDAPVFRTVSVSLGKCLDRTYMFETFDLLGLTFLPSLGSLEAKRIVQRLLGAGCPLPEKLKNCLVDLHSIGFSVLPEAPHGILAQHGCVTLLPS